MATNLRVNFIGKNELSKTTAVASRDLKKLGKTATSVGKGINKAFGGLGVGLGFAALGNTLKTAVVGFEKAQIASKKLDNVLTSMGFGAASKRVDDYAESLQNQVYVDADVIKSAQTKLATFSELTKSVGIAGGAFDRATVASLDLAAVFGGDASSQAVALGKALQDPIKGITALSRQGVTFTKEEKAKIKTLVETNRTLEAQDLILSTIEQQVGGTAKAGASEFTKLQLIFDSMLDTIGESLLPILEEFSTYLASPAGQKNLKEIVDSFVAMGKAIAGVISFLIKNADAVKAVITAVVFLKVAWHTSYLAVKIYTAMTGNAVRATKLLRTALITTGIGALVVLVGELAAAWMSADEAQDEYNNNDLGPDFDEVDNKRYLDWIEKNKDNLIPDWNIDEWMKLGYESYGAYTRALYDAFKKRYADKKKLAVVVAEQAEEVRKALDAEINKIKGVAEKFRDTVSVAFGLFGEDEYSVFNVDYFKGKLQRMVTAAKGFASNLKQILKTPGSQPLVNELIGMGPVEGNIAAKALLASGDLKEIVGLKSSLYNTGAQAGSVQATMGNATYEININKAVISASDIIREIKLLEKKTGRKYLVGS
jgi:hypothetical protein